MSDAVKLLYQFIQNRRLGPLLWADPDYQEVSHCRQVQEDRLRALLDEEGCQVLDAMLEELFNEQSLEQAALFQATLSLCRELNQAGSR